MVRRTNIKDVAARAGVSYQTVSKVLNGLAHVTPDTETRVWTAARELGYRPHLYARNLRAKRSRMIGYSWVPTRPNQANHILDMFLSSMVHEAEAAGYHLLPFPWREDQDEVSAYRELIDAGKVDGFVLSGVNYADPRVAFLLAKEVPFVAFGRAGSAEQGEAHAYVDVDGQAGLQLAVDHLLAQGHRRIAVLAWPEPSRVGHARLAGYFGALAVAGIAPDPDLIARGEGVFDFGYAATRRWLGLPLERRPTGIVALNDTLAIGALHAALAQGLTVGHDLAIVGFDDTPTAQFLLPALTSVRQPIREAGRQCVEILVAKLEGRPLPSEQVLLAPALIVRASSQSYAAPGDHLREPIAPPTAAGTLA